MLLGRVMNSPSRSMSLACATSKSDSPSGACTVLTELSFSSVNVTLMLRKNQRIRR